MISSVARALGSAQRLLTQHCGGTLVIRWRLLVYPCRSGPSLTTAAQQDLRLLAKVLAQGALQGLSQQEQEELQQQYHKQGLDLPQLVQQAQLEGQRGQQVWAGPSRHAAAACGHSA
jgi:hypothetical protein